MLFQQIHRSLKQKELFFYWRNLHKYLTRSNDVSHCVSVSIQEGHWPCEESWARVQICHVNGAVGDQQLIGFCDKNILRINSLRHKKKSQEKSYHRVQKHRDCRLQSSRQCLWHNPLNFPWVSWSMSSNSPFRPLNLTQFVPFWHPPLCAMFILVICPRIRQFALEILHFAHQDSLSKFYLTNQHLKIPCLRIMCNWKFVLV